MPNGSISELVDRQAAAAMLGVSPRTLDRWHHLRKGPARVQYGTNGLVRYRVVDLEEWIIRNRADYDELRRYRGPGRPDARSRVLGHR
jgi:hypothetical protein